MADDLTGKPPDAFAFGTARGSVTWPERGVRQFELAWGFSVPPTWALATYEGGTFSEHAAWPLQRTYTISWVRDRLIAEGVPADAAETMARDAARLVPERFDDES